MSIEFKIEDKHPEHTQQKKMRITSPTLLAVWEFLGETAHAVQDLLFLAWLELQAGP